MDRSNIRRLSLQLPVPGLTGVGWSAFLRALRFPRFVRGIRTRLLSGIRLLPGIPIPGIPLLLLGIWLLSATCVPPICVSAICVSALWIRPALLLGKRTICPAGVLRRLERTWLARGARPFIPSWLAVSREPTMTSSNGGGRSSEHRGPSPQQGAPDRGGRRRGDRARCAPGA